MGKRLQSQFACGGLAQEGLKLCFVVGQIHVQCIEIAGERGTIGLDLLQRQSGNLTQLVAQLHLFDGPVQRSKRADQILPGLFQRKDCGIECLRPHENLVLSITQLADGISIVFL